MSLFEKKKEETKEAKCSCSCGCGTSDVQGAPTSSTCYGETVERICCIKVLGSGCKNCHVLFENAKEAVKTAGLSVEVEYITDLQKVMEYGVMSMPALVINDQVVSMGKVLSSTQVIKLFENQLQR